MTTPGPDGDGIPSAAVAFIVVVAVVFGVSFVVAIYCVCRRQCLAEMEAQATIATMRSAEAPAMVYSVQDTPLAAAMSVPTAEPIAETTAVAVTKDATPVAVAMYT